MGNILGIHIIDSIAATTADTNNFYDGIVCVFYESRFIRKIAEIGGHYIGIHLNLIC